MGRFALTLRATFIHVARRHYSSKQLDPMILVHAMTGTVKNPTYSDAVQRLNSCQSGWELLEARREAGIMLDHRANEQMRTWMRRLGYKTSDFDRLNIVHVAGTKGKGTTCAYVNSMLTHVGKKYGRPGKIGLYTSPHLVSVRERVRINSEPISEEQFTKYFFEVWEGLESSAEREGIDPSEKPTYFRMMTVLSYHVFMREKVDTAVYEVGVGGELDSTNIVERPAVTGITTLGIDHVEALGDTVDKIAWHKAGIFKPGSPAYSVRQVPLATPVLVDRAEEKNVHLDWVDISPEVRQVKIQPQEDFQFKNASLAVALTKSVLKTLDVNMEPESGPSKKSSALPDEFVKGLESVVWRARGETKVVGKQTYYLDGAHTEDSLEIVGSWFGKSTKSSKNPKILIFNQQSLRDSIGLIHTLHAGITKAGVKFDHVIFCTNITYKNRRFKVDFVNRNVDPAALASMSWQKMLQAEWQKLDPEAEVLTLPTIEDAREYVGNISDEQGEVHTLVTGSFHLVGGFLSILEGEEFGLAATTKMEQSVEV